MDALRCICHLDMDAFYASVEQRDHPQFRGRPVVVGADPRDGLGRGVVAACSYEARRFGIHSALPIGQAYRRCPDAVFVRPRMARYVEVSRRIRQIMQQISPLIEPLSIDEAFLDLGPTLAGETGNPDGQGWFDAAEGVGRRLKERIREQEGLAASVGIAPNKFIAKIASDLRKPDALVVVRPEEVEMFLEPLPVTRLWGVGPKTAERLHQLGIRMIREVRGRDPQWLEEKLGKLGRHLWLLASGKDDRPVVTSREIKSVSRERTFGEDTRDGGLLEKTLRHLAERVAADLERHQLAGGTVVLKLRYSDFTTFTRQVSLRYPMAAADELSVIAVRLLHRHWNPALRIRLIGIGVSRLRPRFGGQMSLFCLL